VAAPVSTIGEEPVPRQQRLALGLISAGTFSALSIWFSASAVLPQLSKNWGISKTEGSFLTSTVNIGFVIGCIVLTVTGWADQVKPQVLIVAGTTGAAISNLALLLAENLAGGLAARLWVGFFMSLVYPPGVKLLSTWFSPKQRGAATGFMFGAFCLGSAFPQLLNGLVAGHSWKLVVVITSSVSFLSGGVLYWMVSVGPFRAVKAAAQLSKGRFDASKCMSVMRNKQVMLSILAYCGHMWEMFCVWAWIATFVEESWQLSRSVSPFVAFAVISLGGPGSWIGGMLGDRWGRVRVAETSLAVSGTCVATLGLLAHEGPLRVRLVIAMVWGFAAVADSPQFSSIITISADPDQVGTALTLQMMCGYLLTVLALWVMPVIAASVSWRWSFFSLAAGPVVSLVALQCMGRGSPDGADDSRGPSLAPVPAIVGA